MIITPPPEVGWLIRIRAVYMHEPMMQHGPIN